MAENSTSSSLISLRRGEGEGLCFAGGEEVCPGEGGAACSFLAGGASSRRSRRRKPKVSAASEGASGSGCPASGTGASSAAEGRPFRLRSAAPFRRAGRAAGEELSLPEAERELFSFSLRREAFSAAEGAAPVGGREEASSLLRAASRRERGASAGGAGCSAGSVYSAQNSDRMSFTDMLRTSGSAFGRASGKGRGAGASVSSSGKSGRAGASTVSGSGSEKRGRAGASTVSGSDSGAGTGLAFFAGEGEAFFVGDGRILLTAPRRSWKGFRLLSVLAFSEKKARGFSAGAGGSCCRLRRGRGWGSTGAVLSSSPPQYSARMASTERPASSASGMWTSTSGTARRRGADTAARTGSGAGVTSSSSSMRTGSSFLPQSSSSKLGSSSGAGGTSEARGFASERRRERKPLARLFRSGRGFSEGAGSSSSDAGGTTRSSSGTGASFPQREARRSWLSLRSRRG